MPYEGEQHPLYSGCVWSTELGTYVCDDGSTVEGDPYFIIGGGDEEETLTTTSTAPRVRTADELARRIPQGGYLTVGPNSSELIVAINETWKFKVEPDGTGNYRISASNNNSLILYGGLGLVGLLALVTLGKR